MMTRLAENNRVLFVDPVIALTTFLFHPEESKKLWRKCKFWMRGPRQITTNLYIYYPPPVFLQFGHFAVNDKLNQIYLGRSIRRVAKKMKFSSPILWLYDPYAIDPRGQFNEKFICYDCNDDISSLALAHKRKRLLNIEDNIIGKANVVFATSPNIFAEKKKKNSKTFYLPSGVDFDLFHEATSASLPLPDDVKQYKNRS
jgi:hypothetical protein